jgi:hypothetical protein
MSPSSVWQPGPRPAWVRTLNRLGDRETLSLDAGELLREATARTGLGDFGGEHWREGFEIFVSALEDEAQLNFVGRVLARSDVLNWLENRLRITDARKRHPEIDDERVEKPVFILGLPRTGTSILHDLLGADPASRVPLAWEVRHPCPPPEAASYETDDRIALADEEVRLWCDIVPEYDSMHELGGQIPVECIQLTAHEFRSDELSGRHMVPSYAGWLAGADLVPAYEFHRGMLQLLQWRAPGARWVLKAPSHLGALSALLAVYPDARIVWTHRDPLTVMASVASILFSTAWVRSDAVDAEQVLGWFTGETCAALLAAGCAARDGAPDPEAQFHDVRYADLVDDPGKTVRGIYEHFDMTFDDDAAASIDAAIASKPKGRHGAHRYDFSNTGWDPEEERKRFVDYQARFDVVSEG